ncbi:unnamed protein product [Protopolystoma xenopodis]|uniref:Uncharacterized protein n=1 Tax=Protopolystoma xenopodis TaxID=117903 RepID=A0A3S5B9N7_9PLAT|nr:unnamed protein product [Protopolystoma xenopodis]
MKGGVFGRYYTSGLGGILIEEFESPLIALGALKTSALSELESPLGADKTQATYADQSYYARKCDMTEPDCMYATEETLPHWQWMQKA